MKDSHSGKRTSAPMSPSATPISPDDKTSPTNREMTSSEKKRLRDRRAQKTLRERRERQMRHLQQQVNECHRLHDPERSQQLIDLVRALQEENRVLRYHQEQLRKLVHSWTISEDRTAVVAVAQQPPAASLHDIGSNSRASRMYDALGMGDDTLSHIDPALTDPGTSLLEQLQSSAPETNLISVVEPSIVATAAPSHPHESLIPITQLLAQSPEGTAVVVSGLEQSPILGSKDDTDQAQSLDMLPPLVPAWMLVPLDEDSHSVITMATCPWLSRPDLITGCPDLPSPLDLLHGTRRNWLADSIHQSLKGHNCRDPEVLAMGWLVYLYAKWRVSPNPEAFSNIPTFMRPVLGQLQKTHPSCLDQIVWPQLRLNLIHRCSEDKMLAAMDLLSCCLKVRWKWGEDFLERDENDQLQVRKSFLDAVLSPDGWGITSEFIDTYPELVRGMDLSRILYSVV